MPINHIFEWADVTVRKNQGLLKPALYPGPPEDGEYSEPWGVDSYWGGLLISEVYAGWGFYFAVIDPGGEFVFCPSWGQYEDGLVPPEGIHRESFVGNLLGVYRGATLMMSPGFYTMYPRHVVGTWEEEPYPDDTEYVGADVIRVGWSYVPRSNVVLELYPPYTAQDLTLDLSGGNIAVTLARHDVRSTLQVYAPDNTLLRSDDASTDYSGEIDAARGKYTFKVTPHLMPDETRTFVLDLGGDSASWDFKGIFPNAKPTVFYGRRGIRHNAS